jgi:hypothetical protein
MATINQGLPTLLDIARRTDPNGKIARIVESLTVETPLLQDMPWFETNGTDGHLITTREALPSLTWRKYNEGVLPTKSRTGQFVETCGMLEGISKVDVALAKRNGDEAGFRMSEDLAFVSSYSRVLEDAFFYASQKVNPERITGLSPRLDALSGIPYSSQVIVHGSGQANGDSDCASIWLVGWGERKVYGIYPKGSTAGLQMKDLGEELVTDSASATSTGAEFLAYRSHFKWEPGLAVEDARYLVRICNIDSDNLARTGSTLIDAMEKACEQIQSLTDCRPVFYCNRTIRSYLRSQARDTVKSGGGLTFENIEGRPMVYFGGVPIHRTDALLNTEAPLT